MMRGFWKGFLGVTLLLLAGCGEEIKSHDTTRLLMGTLVAITTWGVPTEQETPAVAAAFAEMERVEKLMSSYLEGTAVDRINRAPRGEWHEVPEELALVLELGLRMQELSGDAFDPGLFEVSRLWGFSGAVEPHEPPPPAVLDELVRQRRCAGITLGLQQGKPHVYLENAAVGIDLGGIAKGYAVDRAVAVLRRHGVENAIVTAGGDMRVIGNKGGKPWRIGVQHPRDKAKAVAMSEVTGDLAISTSGDYERFFTHNGVRYHHLLNPADGRPARSGLLSVTIQAANSMTADALSTAVFVLGADKGLRFLEQQPGAEGLVVQEGMLWRKTQGFVGTWLGG